MAEQKYCRECSELTLVLGKVDYSKKSKRFTFPKGSNDEGLLYLHPSNYDGDLCYWHEKMSDKNRRLEDGIPKYYLQNPRPPSKAKREVKVVKIHRRY